MPICLVEKEINNLMWLPVISIHTLPVKRFYSQGDNSESNYISYYLAGLIEGDGHFNTPKKLKAPSGSARVPTLEVIFALKDRPSAELFKSLFGGNLYDRPNQKLTR
jgi:hypothetical protein